MEIQAPQDTLAASAATLDQLAKKFSQLLISDPTQISRVTAIHDSNSDTLALSDSESRLGSITEDPSCFPLGLCNSASVYQESIQDLIQAVHEIPLTGAQKGLVLSITPQGYIMH